MSYVIAFVSHKGGTGRSVSLANVAAQLYLRRAGSVCIVDLDLAAPTMGSILEVKGMESGVPKLGKRGAPESVYDLLLWGEAPNAKLLVDLRTQSEVFKKIALPSAAVTFLPGARPSGDWVQPATVLYENIRPVVARLKDEGWDYILLDIRSGLSDVLEALGRGADELVNLVLAHFRWTQQHLVGLDALLTNRRMTRFGDRIGLVRTAVPIVEKEPKEVQKEAAKENESLKKWAKDNITIGGKPFDLTHPMMLGDIPLDPRLRWRERILLPTSSTDVSYPTFEAFQSLAASIQNVRGSG